jgi:hypothetical protein
VRRRNRFVHHRRHFPRRVATNLAFDGCAGNGVCAPPAPMTCAGTRSTTVVTMSGSSGGLAADVFRALLRSGLGGAAPWRGVGPWRRGVFARAPRVRESIAAISSAKLVRRQSP